MNPYPGLRPFDGEYAPFFFGRDRQVAELIERLRGNRFVAVVGLSGSGKSSLVRAGLLPALRAGQLGYAGSGWRIATIRPSTQPVATLAAELNKDEVLGPSSDRAGKLESSTFGLLEATREGRPAATNLLVFVDQFEDLFRLVDDGKLGARQAAHFINLLLAVPAEPRSGFPVYVVITLRSEYLGSCARFYGLPEALNRSQYLAPRLSPEQLHEAIEAPAALMDVAFEPALVQRLQVEASSAPDELPRLQHLLMRLWEFRTGETITLDEYRLPRIGELQNALDLHAEEVYTTLTEEQKGIARRVFQRLTAWDASSRDARRPTGLRELAAVSGAAPETVSEVVRRFREAHFLTEIPAAGGEPLLDITHESLIRHWKTLEAWAKEEARFKEIFLGLAGERRPVWNDVMVREAIDWRDNLRPNEAWAERYAPGRLGAARDMLKQLEQDLTAAARLRRRLVGGLVGVALLLFMLSGWALWERSRAAATASAAQEQAELALARQLAAESVSLLPTAADSDVPATLLAVESMKRRPLLENHAALRQATALMVRQVSGLAQEGTVRAVAFSPDGKWLATGSDDKTARVMEAATGKEVSRLAHQDAVNAVAFSPDGKWVATGSLDKTARVMEAATGKEVSRLVHQGEVLAVAISPDGKWVATGSKDKTARVIEAATGKEVSRLAHRDGVFAVAFSPDGKWVATGSDDQTARVMEAATGKEVSRLAHQGNIYAVAFSPDGKRVATGSEDDTARVMDAATGKEVSRLTHQGIVRAVAFSPDGKWIATGSEDKTARVMEAASGKEVSRLAHQNWVSAVAFSPDGKWVATGSDDETARVMEAASGKEVSRLALQGGALTVAFSPDGKWLATGGEDKTARVTEAATGKKVWRLAHQGSTKTVDFSPDGKWVATGSSDKTARLLETASGKEVWRFAHEGPVQGVTFSPDGKRLATGSDDKTARVLDAASGKEVWRLVHEGPVQTLTFSADGKFLATGSDDKTARVLDAATGREVWRLAHQGSVNSVAFSPDGKWVATASSDKTARVVEAASGKEVSRLAHEGIVNSAAFSPNGKWMATGSADRSARVIEAASGKEVSRLTHQRPVNGVSFSPDGKRVATASDDKTARVMEAATGRELVRHQMNGFSFDVLFVGNSTLAVLSLTPDDEIEKSYIVIDPAELIRDACYRLPRNLTREEWDRYLGSEPCRATCPNLPNLCQAK